MERAVLVSIRQDQKLPSQSTSFKTTQAGLPLTLYIAIEGNVIGAILA